MKTMLSLLFSWFTGSFVFSQVTYLETEACPLTANTLSKANGYELFGGGLAVRDNEAIVAGAQAYALYEKCEGSWKITYIGDDAGAEIQCAIGDDYYALHYRTPLGTPSYSVISIYEKSNPGVSIHWIELADIMVGDPMWFFGNDLYVNHRENIVTYRESEDWDPEVVIDPSPGFIGFVYRSSADDRMLVHSYDEFGEIEYLDVYNEVGGVWDEGESVGEALVDENLNIDGAALSGSYMYRYVTEWDPIEMESTGRIEVYEYEGGDVVLLNDFDFYYPSILYGANDNVILAVNSDLDELVLIKNEEGDWSEYAQESLPTPSGNTVTYGCLALVRDEDMLIGECLRGPSTSYGAGNYMPGAVHFYEELDVTPMELLIYADGTSTNGTFWEIVDDNGDPTGIEGGPYSSGCALRTETFDLSPGSYGLRVIDEDNTVCSGGFLLRTVAGDVVLDASNVPAFTSPSEYTTIDNFQIPVGPIEVTNSPLPASSNTWLIASEDCELQALCEGVGPLNTATTAYRWEYFKPHSAVVTDYWRYVPYNWNGSSGFSGFPGANFCEKVRASKPGALVTAPIPLNQYLNIRVHARVNGVDRAWGPVKTVYYTTSMRPANWRVSPNPIASDNGQLRLEVVTQDEAGIPIIYDSELRMQSLRLLDLSGRVMTSKGGLQYSIETPFFWDISDVELTPGMYLVEVTTNTGVSATKIMVQ